MNSKQDMSKLTRRRMLGGLGLGTGLMAQLWNQSRARAAAAPGNFFMFATPNGFVRSKFGGQGSGAAWSLAPSLENLAAYKNDLITIRGLCNKSSSTFNSHEDMCKIMTFVHGGGDKETVYSASFDQEMGKALNTKPLTLGVPPQYELVYTRVSWVGPSRPEPKIYSPVEAYAAAFSGQLGQGQQDKAAILLQTRRKSAVDLVAQEANTFCARLSGSDKENCELYLDTIHSLGKRLGTGSQASAVACAVDPGRKSMIDGANGTTGVVEKLRAIGDAHLEVAATALACGARRVGSIIWQQDSGGINPTNGGNDSYNHHAVTHANDTPTWEKIDRFYADRFARFIGRLTELKAIENTVVVWASGISEEHNQCDQAVVVAGGKSLGIKSNQNIRYPWVGPATSGLFQNAALAASRNPANASLADLYVSIQKALGIKSDTFGDAAYCKGGLKEVYDG